MDSQDLYAKLAAEMPFGAMIWRVEHSTLTLLYANALAGQLLGQSLDETRDAERLLARLVTDGGIYTKEMLMRTAREQKAQLPCECAWSRPSAIGSAEIWLKISFVPLGNHQAALLLEEITSQRFARKLLTAQAQDLARSNAELEEFAYVASHELQQPLSTISNTIQLLEIETGESLDESAKALIRQSLSGVWRMKDLINALLEYSRIGTQAKTMEVINGDLLLEQVVEDLHSFIHESNATLVLPSMPKLTGDRSQLQRLFQNLIGNAIKFRGDAKPHIRVTVNKKQEGWEFRIHDNGIGIHENDQHRIFGIFQRIHSRERFSGTGLGLALCKKIVETHSGRIWVKSKEGQGSTFIFTLPFQLMAPRL